MRSDNPWVIPIVAAIVSGLIVGVIVSEIYEHKEEDLLKSQIDSSVQNAENLLNRSYIKAFFTEAIPRKIWQN
jgi:uncharacterized membrane protein YraQ (UPF0718 family)